MNAMAGYDARDSTSSSGPKEDYARDLATCRSPACASACRAEYFGDGIDAGVRTARRAGAALVRIARARRPSNRAAQLGPGGAGVLRHRAGRSLVQPVALRRRALRPSRAASTATSPTCTARTRAEGFGAEVKRRILVGTYVLSHGYYDAYYLQAQKVRRLIARDFAAALRAVRRDPGPDAPTTAFEIGAKTEDPVQMYLNDIFTVAGEPRGPARHVDSVRLRRRRPAGRPAAHGQLFSEARLLGVAHRYQQATDWHLRVPTRDPAMTALGSRRRHRDPRPAPDASKIFSGASHRLRRGAEHPGLRRRYRAARARCRC